MFKDLKKKFVIINMSLLTLVFVAIFSVMYLIVATTNDREMDHMLDTLLNAPRGKALPPNPFTSSGLVIEVDNQGNIIHMRAPLGLNDDAVTDAVAQVIDRERDTGKVDIDGMSYAYRKAAMADGARIALINREPQLDMMTSLLLTFLAVGGISLGLLLLVSIYLANRAVNPIKLAFDKQQQFIADASHELRTPLTIINTNLDLVSSQEDQTVKSQRKWINNIYAQTGRMANLVNDMLSLARLDHQQQRLIPQEFDLSQTLNSILLSFEAIFFENQITLQTEIQPQVTIAGNREGIKQLIAILLDNAAKNTPAQGVITVSLTANHAHQAKLSVKNTGAGIPPEHLEKIFERFYRVDEARDRESGGYGLGLAIARSIVEQHHGKIYARSQVGVDTTFTVEL